MDKINGKKFARTLLQRQLERKRISTCHSRHTIIFSDYPRCLAVGHYDGLSTVFRPIYDWIEINQYIVDFSSRQRWPLSGDVTVGPEFIAEKENDMIK